MTVIDPQDFAVTAAVDPNFLKDAHVDHIVSKWREATPDEKAQGKRWYSDAHIVAKAIAHGDAAKGAGILATYSPQTPWPQNLFNAARVLHEGKGIGGPGSGMMATDATRHQADRILSGEHYDNVLKGHKVRAFASLIHHAGKDPEDHTLPSSHVCIDRHAVSVAMGRRLSEQEFNSAGLSAKSRYHGVCEHYHAAAHIISETEGEEIAPHQVQAVTWLTQQRQNQAEDEARAHAEPTARGRGKGFGNAIDRWTEHHMTHHPDLKGKAPTAYASLSMVAILDRIWTMGARFDRYEPDGMGGYHHVTPMENASRKYLDYGGRSGYVPIAHNTWAHKDTDGNTHIRHHQTDILSFSPHGDITIDRGGWDSQTTRSRINAFMPKNMKLMRNPSRAAGAPEHVLAHNPNGGSIWARYDEPETKGKHGLHKDTVLHPFEDGFSINAHTGEVLEHHAVQPGTLARPPRARGFNPDHEPSSRPSRNYYDMGHDYSSGPWHGGPYPNGRTSPVVEPHRPNFGEGNAEPGAGYSHERDRAELEHEDRRSQSNPGSDSYDSGASMDFSHHDMPGEGESFDDWLDRTTKPAEKVACPTCKGRSTVRKPGPVPEGVQPWEHRMECPTCEGEGLVGNTHRLGAKTGALIDLEALSSIYLDGLQMLAYGEIKAPTAVDTLREDACPICSESDSYDGDQCGNCGYIAVPQMFRDPDLDKAKLLDLRQNPVTGDPNDTDPNLPMGGLPDGPDGGEPVDADAVDENGDLQDLDGDGDVDAADQEIAGEMDDDEEEDSARVEGEVRDLDNADDDPDRPIDPEDVDEEGDIGGPDDPEAAEQHVNQGGEPFTKGPNAPTPEEPMEPGEDQEAEEDAEEGAAEAELGEGGAGYAGDGVPDLFCPSCGFGADSAHPTTTPNDPAAPANEGDGAVEGDVCPNCQKATMMSGAAPVAG